VHSTAVGSFWGKVFLRLQCIVNSHYTSGKLQLDYNLVTVEFLNKCLNINKTFQYFKLLERNIFNPGP